ncbi:MAG: hypothetical protein N4A35_01845 [Flavobacteriales bacterium]|jgi:FtsZ-interacting cell division protein YlmF|nr:hypothetical protein [Flavobacteriales bacterium]
MIKTCDGEVKTAQEQHIYAQKVAIPDFQSGIIKFRISNSQNVGLKIFCSKPVNCKFTGARVS